MFIVYELLLKDECSDDGDLPLAKSNTMRLSLLSNGSRKSR